MRFPLSLVDTEEPSKMTTLIGYRCKHSNVFSQVVLIARETYFIKIIFLTLRPLAYNNLSYFLIKFESNTYSITYYKFAGDYCDGDTPLPIPNRVVKPISANDTACVGVRKSRSSPASFILKLKRGI